MSSPFEATSRALPEPPAERLIKALEAMASASLWAALERAAGTIAPESLDQDQKRRLLAVLQRYAHAMRSQRQAILAARLLKAAEALLDHGMLDLASSILDALVARGVTRQQAFRLARLQSRRGC